jgi:hypothetical protein
MRFERGRKSDFSMCLPGLVTNFIPSYLPNTRLGEF